MGKMASQITSLTIVYSIVYPGADLRKHQSPASLAFVWGIHGGPVHSPLKCSVTRKMFPFDDVIMHEEKWSMPIDDRKCKYKSFTKNFKTYRALNHLIYPVASGDKLASGNLLTATIRPHLMSYYHWVYWVWARKTSLFHKTAVCN